MRSGESAKVFWKFSFNLGPPRREVGILVSMWAVRDVVGLADVGRSGIRLAIRRVIAQRFHLAFGAFVHHDSVVVATHALNSDSLKLVNSCVGAIFSLQFALERIIWLVWRRGYAHDVPDPIALGVPAM
jgi:hypothetical protein